MTKLRDYQQETIRKVNQAFARGSKSVLLVLPTGGGKSTVMSAYVKYVLSRSVKILFLVHSKELVRQFAQRLWTQFNIPSGIIMAGHKPDYSFPAQVASVQSAVRRKLPSAGLIIVDEAHRIKASTYLKILDQYENSRLIGLTATPFRNDGKGFDDLFDELVQEVKIQDLINQGFLVSTKVYGTENKIDLSDVGTTRGDYDNHELYEKYNDVSAYHDVVQNYLKYAEGKKAIVFNVNVEHSKHQNEIFLEYGVKSAEINGTTPKGERDRIVKMFAEDKIDVLNNVTVFTEGFDIPGTEVVILNRATKSLNFYVQAIGRGLRPLLDSENNVVVNEDGSLKKPHCIVLDHGQNTVRHGFVEEYDQVRFTLEGRKKGSAPKEEETTKDCPSCFAIVGKFDKECSECGHKFTRKKAELKMTEGRPMVLLDRDAVVVQRLRLMDNKKGKQLPLHLLRILCHLKNWKDGWWFYAAIEGGLVNIDKDAPGARRKVKVLIELEEKRYGTDKLCHRLGILKSKIDQRYV